MSNPKRLLLIVLVIILVAAIAVFVHLITRDPFVAVVAHYQELKQPIIPADFETPAPPDDQNACVAVIAVAPELRLSPDEDRWESSLEQNQPVTSDDFASAEKIISTRADAFAHLHKAVNLPQMRWPGPVIAPIVASPISGASKYNEVRQLATMLRYAAIVHHHQHNDAAALNDIADIFRLAEIAGHDGPLIAHLVQVGITALGCDTIQLISPDLRVDTATRPLMTKFIANLLDDAAAQSFLVRDWQVERATSLETLRDLARSPIARITIGSGASSVAREDDRALSASTKSTWPAAKADLRRTQSPAPSHFSIGQNLAAILAPSVDRSLQTDFRLKMMRHLTATMLAIRLYQADHNNQFPATLADLTPTYLPAIPTDPFASGASPIHYRRDPSAILYSVGEDGIDDGGNATRKNPESEWSSPDYVIVLSPSDQPRAPQTAPSSRPE